MEFIVAPDLDTNGDPSLGTLRSMLDEMFIVSEKVFSEFQCRYCRFFNALVI